MRVLLSVILFSASSSIGQIPLKTLISFAGAKYATVADYLITKGWEYKGTDTSGGYHSTWTYKYNMLTNTAQYWLYCRFKNYPKLNKDSISGATYMNIPQSEYLEILNELPLNGFKKTETMDFQGDLDVVFEKKIQKDDKFLNLTIAELLQFLAPGSNIKRTMYQFSIDRLE